jgi:AraC-like DNA-binding protein/quercetin dioxygenase-like cupin family protein
MWFELTEIDESDPELLPQAGSDQPSENGGDSVLVRTWLEESPWMAPVTVARHALEPGSGFLLHRHDFAEVFWCESGQGTHIVNGCKAALRAGDIVFIRPNDVHLGYGAEPTGLVIVNVAFAYESLRLLSTVMENGGPWKEQAPLPMHLHLDRMQMELLHGWAIELSAPNQLPLDVACFLLSVARLVMRAPEGELARGLPLWLVEALQAFSDPSHLPGGIKTLARLAGRSPAYLNRVVRTQQGRTATELVAQLRLNWAARELRMTDRPILEIAELCGMPNPSYFYRRFRGTFGVTPKHYRQGSWQMVGPAACR